MRHMGIFVVIICIFAAFVIFLLILEIASAIDYHKIVNKANERERQRKEANKTVQEWYVNIQNDTNDVQK